MNLKLIVTVLLSTFYGLSMNSQITFQKTYGGTITEYGYSATQMPLTPLYLLTSPMDHITFLVAEKDALLFAGYNHSLRNY